MIKNIIFDLGGVLFNKGTRAFVRYLQKNYDLDHEKVYDFLNYSEVGNAYREGKLAKETYWKEVKKHLQLRETPQELEKQWVNAYEIIEETREIIKKLSNHYKVYFLSDNTKDRTDIAEKKYHFSQLFQGGVFSHEVGYRKPHPKIYEITLERLSLDPSESLFIDDKQINLPPAEILGMKTLLFTNPEQLRKDLEVLGLL